jgi:hypothetical protein
LAQTTFPSVRALVALVLFGIAFGYVEASVVTYLRDLYAPLHQRFKPPASENDLFPLLRLNQLQEAGPQAMRWLWTELFRELATLLMLSAIAWAMGRNFRQWLAGFMVAFGVWDIFYYVFLKLVVDWPDSLFTWDLLFLLPVPWAGPVLAPLLVAVTMVLAGSAILLKESAARPVPIGAAQIVLLLIGATIIVLAFCWDYRNLLSGGFPNPFHWPLFIAGMVIALIGLLSALRPSRFGAG